jgi:hypothetical protein
MSVQAGAEPVDKRHGADVQGRLVHICRTGAVGLQALRNDPQEDAQHHVEHCPVTLHEIAQSLRHREHPLAHRQTGEDVVAEVRRRLHHAPCVARGAHAPAFAGIGPRSSRAHNRRTRLWQSRGQRCRIRGICERPGGHRAWGCGGRPGRRTGRHWQVHAKSRSARRWFGTAGSARGGAGCRALALYPLARQRVNASALGVQWRAWGSASVGWVPDDTGFISSFVAGRANHWARKYS